MEVWICGQIRGEAIKIGGMNRYVWDFQGVFTSEGLARRACLTDKYFIMPVEMDRELSPGPVIPTRGYYPRL